MDSSTAVLPSGGGKPVVAVVLDISGSMRSHLQKLSDMLINLFGVSGFEIYIVPFGPMFEGEPGFDGKPPLGKTVWDSSADVTDYFKTEFFTYVHHIEHLTLIPKPINAILFITDGTFNDRPEYVPLLHRLAVGGTLSAMTDVAVLFPPGVAQSIINEMTLDWSKFIDVEPNVACNVPHISVLSSYQMRNPDTLSDIVKDKVKGGTSLDYPDGWLNIAGLVAINPNVSGWEIAREWEKPVGLIDAILEKMMSMVKYNPDLLVSDDPNNPWVRVHKYLYLTSAKERYIKRLMDFRDAKTTSAHAKECIQKMQKKSFVSDTGLVVSTVDRLRKRLDGCKYLMFDAKFSEDTVVDAISSKNYTFLIRSMFGGVSVEDGKINSDGTLTGLPIIDGTPAPAECRNALALFLSQYCPVKVTNDALMVVILEIYARASVMKDADSLRAFINMVVTALRDEPWLTSMMGWDPVKGEFNFDNATLLFSWNNANCFVLFLRDLRKECFGCYKASGKEIVPFIKMEELYRQFCKITNWQRVLKVIRDCEGDITVKRDYRRVVEGSVLPFGSLLTDFSFLQIVSVPPWKTRTYVKGGETITVPGTTFRNSPTIGVVMDSKSMFNSKGRERVELDYKQIDTHPPPLEEARSALCEGRHSIPKMWWGPDTRSHTRCADGIAKLNLRHMLGFKPGDDPDEYLKKIDRVYHFLISITGKTGDISADAKKFYADTGFSPEIFKENAVEVPGCSDQVLKWVSENICVSPEASFFTETETHVVPVTTAANCIHVPENLMALHLSRANPNMKQMIASLESKIIPPSNTPFNVQDERGVRTCVRLTDMEMNNISRELRSRIASCFDVSGGKKAQERTCMLCYDNMCPRRQDDEWGCCPIAVCRSCRDEYAVEHVPGKVLSRAIMACPNCQRPIITGNPRIDTFLKGGTDVLVNDVCRICDSCHNVFAQPNPTCGATMTVEELTSSTCEACTSESVAKLAGDGVMWVCPHGDCGMTGKKEYGCDYMRCPACNNTSCSTCSFPFSPEHDDMIGGDWSCLGPCTEEGIDDHFCGGGY